MSILKIDLTKIKVNPLDSKIYFTVEDILSLPEFPDGPLIELIDGDIYLPPSPTPEHQTIISNLNLLINLYLMKNKAGKLFISPIDVYYSEKDYFIPDLVFISKNNLDIVNEKNIKGTPDLIIEVVSSNRKRDFITKKELYQRMQVREYWIIDKENTEIIIYSLENNTFESQRVFKSGEVLSSNLSELEELKISVNEIFNENL